MLCRTMLVVFAGAVLIIAVIVGWFAIANSDLPRRASGRPWRRRR
jgi:hypothetical protein